MCDLGITPENFNPGILYILKRKSEPGIESPYHSHDFISIIYVLSGFCTYHIEDSLYPVKKGDIVVCNPGVYHGKLIAPGDDIEEFHVGINNISIKNLPRDHIIRKDACPVITPVKYEPDFLRCCSEIIDEQEKDQPGSELALKSLIMKLIVIFLRETYYIANPEDDRLFNFTTYDKANIVSTISSFIDEHYMEEISLDIISKSMYLSPVYISKVFKEETGESPINHLIKVRLSKAKEFLDEGRMSIKEVAKSIGYHDAYYFSKLFKKYYGYPPSRHKGM